MKKKMKMIILRIVKIIIMIIIIIYNMITIIIMMKKFIIMKWNILKRIMNNKLMRIIIIITITIKARWRRTALYNERRSLVKTIGAISVVGGALYNNHLN